MGFENLRRLREAYEIISKINIPNIEPYPVIEAVHNHRMFWKPTNVKKILLAESHHKTPNNEIINEIDASWLSELPRSQWSISNYVRFVYCLAYGESEILVNPISTNGTTDYWKIFYSCLNDVEEDLNNHIPPSVVFRDILKSNTTIHERIQNKINLLIKLKQKGVWLVDASIIGINKNDVKKSTRLKIASLSWENYIKPNLRELGEENDFQILMIGKVLNRKLSGDSYFNTKRVDVINQPNKKKYIKEERIIDYKKLLDFCNYE